MPFFAWPQMIHSSSRGLGVSFQGNPGRGRTLSGCQRLSALMQSTARQRCLPSAAAAALRFRHLKLIILAASIIVVSCMELDETQPLATRDTVLCQCISSHDSIHHAITQALHGEPEQPKLINVWFSHPGLWDSYWNESERAQKPNILSSVLVYQNR